MGTFFIDATKAHGINLSPKARKSYPDNGALMPLCCAINKGSLQHSFCGSFQERKVKSMGECSMWCGK
ncbi:MAG: hypothetical protein FDX18_00175 [Chlorobium sp.]|nr:MAG: hypothetical protein FDX18_00175 [Chlorobium sp.]